MGHAPDLQLGSRGGDGIIFEDVLLEVVEAPLNYSLGLQIPRYRDCKDRTGPKRRGVRGTHWEKQGGEFQEVCVRSNQDGHTRVELAESKGDCKVVSVI